MLSNTVKGETKVKWISSLTMLFTFFSIISGKVMYGRRHPLTHSKIHSSKQLELSVIVPARDEAQRLPRLLKSLAQQTVSVEMIVMDDGSTDQTAEIACAAGASVYSVQADKPSLWQGKSLACYQGATYASTPLLLFVDADVTLTSPRAIQALIDTYYQQDYRGLLSVQPYHSTIRPYESLSALFNTLTVVGTNQFSLIDGQQTTRMAFGPVVLTNSTDYKSTQGHQQAKHHIIEGFALGQAYSQQGLPVNLYEGQQDIQFRMYEDGIQSLVHGWVKHFSVGATATSPKVMTSIVIWLMGSIITASGLILSLLVKPISKVNMGILYILYTMQFIRIHRRVGHFSRWMLCLHPILFIFFSGVFLSSWIQSYCKRSVIWKGRTYHL